MSSSPNISRGRPAEQIRFWSPDALLLVAAIAGFFLVSYLTDPSAPALKVENGTGWMGWFDQGEYHKTARDLASFKLSPSFYWYGYPLMGAMSIRWLPQHPFLLPDLLFVCGMAACFYATCRRFVSWPEAWVLTLISFVLDRSFWTVSLIYPWNSIPTFFAVFAITWLTIFGPFSKRAFWAAAASIGVAAFCRPPDALILTTLYFFGLLLQPAFPGRRLLACAPFLAIGAAIGLQASAHLVLYGSVTSPYLAAVDKVGFDFSQPALKLYQWLVDPSLLTGAMLPPGTPSRGVIDRLPHLLLFLPGLILTVRLAGLRALGVVAAFVPALLIYLAFNPASYPAHYWSYNGFHHVWWFAPWLALWAWLTVSRAWLHLGARLFLPTLLLPLVLVSLFAFREKTLVEYSIEPAGTAATDAGMKSARTEITGRQLLLTIPIPQDMSVDGIRVLGSPAVPFHASVAGSSERFQLEFENRALASFRDFYPLGYPAELNLSFINSPLRPAKDTLLSVRIRDAAEAKPARAQLINLAWSPGANLEHWRKVWGGPPPPPPAASIFADATLLSGWTEGGPGYMWTMGSKAELRLRVPPNLARAGGLAFEMESFRPQTLGIRLNGRDLGQISVAARRTFTLTLPDPLPAGDYTISFSISDPTRPVDIGMNSDTRPLGVALWWIKFTPPP